MTRQPEAAETYAQYMMLDSEREADEAWTAKGYRSARARASCGFDFGLPAGGNAALAILHVTHARLVIERLAAEAASERYYLTTARGRLAAETVEVAARAQLDRTKETA